MNITKRSCDTIVEKNRFFLWELNMEKMDEKCSLMMSQ